MPMHDSFTTVHSRSRVSWRATRALVYAPHSDAAFAPDVCRSIPFVYGGGWRRLCDLQRSTLVCDNLASLTLWCVVRSAVRAGEISKEDSAIASCAPSRPAAKCGWM